MAPTIGAEVMPGLHEVNEILRAGLMFEGFSVCDASRIFMFEDDVFLSSMLTVELTELGYRVSVFSDMSGVALVDEQKPALIILDLSLNHTDAVEILQALSEKGFPGPIQLISGCGSDMLDRVKRVGERRGLDMLPSLQKPFAISDLQLAAKQTIRPAAHESVGVGKGHDAEKGAVDLGTALHRGWVEVWYQPKYGMHTMSLVGAECLCRIRHPDLGILSPATFIPSASIDDLRRLTEFVLRQSCDDWNRFKEAGCGIRLAINIPCALLTTMPLAKLLRQWRPLAPDWPGVILEVTEEQALRDIDAAQEIGTQLSIYGVDLSIDDFGTGYSCLARLRDIPFKEVKLDRSLVDGCVGDPTRAALCRTIIDLSHVLGATTVAEGIEAPEDLAFLRDVGCDTAQGYLLARPMTREMLVARIREDGGRHGRLVDHEDGLKLTA